jgi:hypothetical protein
MAQIQIDGQTIITEEGKLLSEIPELVEKLNALDNPKIILRRGNEAREINSQEFSSNNIEIMNEDTIQIVEIARFGIKTQ